MPVISSEAFWPNDPFNTRRFTQVEGSAGRYVWSSSNGGKLQANGSGVPGDIVAYRINEGRFTDGEVGVAAAVHNSSVFHSFEVLFRVLSDDTYLMARYFQNGTYPNAFIEIYKRVSGTWNVLASVSATSLQGFFTTTDSYYYLTANITGNVIQVRAAPAGGGTASPEASSISGAVASVSHTLAGADATQFGSGIKGGVGWRHTIGGTNDAFFGYSVTTPPTQYRYTYATANGAVNSATPLAVKDQIIDAAKVAYLGDVIGPNNQGDASGFTNGFEPVYRTVKGIVSPAIGDRDWSTADPTLHTQTGAYDAYWGTQGRPANKHFYAYTMDGWRFIVINTQNIDAEQLEFLRYELNRTKGTMKVVLGHRPRFSAGTATGEGDNTDLQPVWDLMKDHAVAYISGAPHNYQRHTARDGIVQIVTGAGGSTVTALNGSYAGLAASNAAASGILRMRFDEFLRTMTGEYISSTGTVLDTFTITGVSPALAGDSPQTALNNAWRMVLTSADGQTIYGELTNATDRTVTEPHMGTPSVGFTLRLDHTLSNTLLNEECLVKAYRGTRLIFHGPVVTVEEVGSEGSRTVRVTAAGAWWRASKRIIPEATLENGFSLAPTNVEDGFYTILGYGNGYTPNHPSVFDWFDNCFTGIRVF